MSDLNVYVSPQTPGATATTPWEEAVRGKRNFIWVHHVPYRDLSRWTHTERKLPFMVVHYVPGKVHWYDMSAHKTLDAAIASAKKLAKELAPERGKWAN